jgi:hypothetical protein
MVFSVSMRIIPSTNFQRSHTSDEQRMNEEHMTVETANVMRGSDNLTCRSVSAPMLA